MRVIYTYFLILISAMVHAQHFQFSQFYAAPLYINPAFTGAHTCSRFAMSYRNQWSAIPGQFTTYQVSYDKPLKEFNSGIGLSMFSDKAGQGSLKSLSFNGYYAYEVKLKDELMGRAGISAGFTQRSIDYSALRFGDQIARGGAANSVENQSEFRTRYFDIGAGWLMYSSNVWGGITVSHLNRPDQSLQGNGSRLPMELKLHGGYNFILEDNPRTSWDQHSVTLAMNYKKQLRFNQIDLGGYYNKGNLVFGMWYRGIPFFKPYSWYYNNDALVFLIGISNEKIRIGYSYDFTVSRLRISNTHGTHELSLTYPMCSKKKKRKKPVLISCPKF